MAAFHGAAIADPGEVFEATDVIDGSKPSRRLIFGGRFGARYFVYYEHGGIGWHTHVVTIDAKAEGPARITGDASIGGDKVLTLKQLRAQYRARGRRAYDF